jgi:hypothetical protein
VETGEWFSAAEADLAIDQQQTIGERIMRAKVIVAYLDESMDRIEAAWDYLFPAD